MRLLLSGILALIPIAVLAQPSFTIAPPSDPLDPVFGVARSQIEDVTTAEQRSVAVNLIVRAIDHYAMHARGTPAHILDISFNAAPSTLFPGGAGQLRETWISGQNWRWDATLADYSLLRISSNGLVQDQQAPRPVPLRLKMLSNAVFAPLQFATPRVSPMRTASVLWRGAQITCILLGPQGSVPGVLASTDIPESAGGRRWEETEFCIDPSTGLLHIYSEAPGVYVFYDYSNALKFHDRILPGAVAIVENGAAVIQAQLTSIADTDPANTAPFTLTAQMKEQGPAVVLNSPMRMNRLSPSPNVQEGATVEPTIVHVTLDDQGKVQESELLQRSGVSEQALELVTQTKIWPAPEGGGTSPRQREAYIRVEFVPLVMHHQPVGLQLPN